MASILHRFSVSNSAEQTTDPTHEGRVLGARDYRQTVSPSRRASTASAATPSSSRVYGARDYQRAIDASAQSSRRASIVEEYMANSDGESEKTGRKYSVPFGPRHYVLATRERGGSL